MATINKKITLTEKNDSGPFFDFEYSINNGLSFTSSVESPIYLPFVGASEIVTTDSLSDSYKLTSRGSCINSVFSGSIGPTPTPTPCVSGLIKYTVGSGTNSEACGLLNLTDIWRVGPWNALSQLYTDETGCTYPPSGWYSDGSILVNWSGTGVISLTSCTIIPTPGPTSTPTPTPTISPTPTPTPTPAGVSFSTHTIRKTGANQHKSTWIGSSQVYNAQNLVVYLTGQSSPSQYVAYTLLNNVRIYTSGGVVYGDWSNTYGTVTWYFDGTTVTVEVNGIVIGGTYSDGSSYTDTWAYQLY